MIRTKLIPDNKRVSIDLPEEYIGKEVEILLYATGELKDQVIQKINTAKFRGALNLSDEQRQDIQQYVTEVRNEWSKDI